MKILLDVIEHVIELVSSEKEHMKCASYCDSILNVLLSHFSKFRRV